MWLWESVSLLFVRSKPAANQQFCPGALMIQRPASDRLVSFAGRAFSDKVDRLKLAEIVKQAIEEKTNLQEAH